MENEPLETNNNLRFKRLSVSPQKKKSDAPVPLPGASITLYGSKFGHSPQPQKPTKMHNHLSQNFIIGNKKALLYTMRQYY